MDQNYKANKNGLHGLVTTYDFLTLSLLLTFWLALPYIKNPASDPTFETYFTKYWVDNYTISLHNFLAMTFQNMRKCWIHKTNKERLTMSSFTESALF